MSAFCAKCGEMVEWPHGHCCRALSCAGCGSKPVWSDAGTYRSEMVLSCPCDGNQGRFKCSLPAAYFEEYSFNEWQEFQRKAWAERDALLWAAGIKFYPIGGFHEIPS